MRCKECEITCPAFGVCGIFEYNLKKKENPYDVKLFLDREEFNISDYEDYLRLMYGTQTSGGVTA